MQNSKRNNDKPHMKAIKLIQQLMLLVATSFIFSAAFYLLTRTYYHKYRLYTIRKIIGKWAPPGENNTEVYIQNVSRLTGIAPDEPIGIPSDQPARWIMLGLAMAIQECGPESIDYFALLRGWTLCRQDVG